jgi:hypothetical protein
MKIEANRVELRDAADAIGWVRGYRSTRAGEGLMLLESYRPGELTLILHEPPYHSEAVVQADVEGSDSVVVAHEPLRAWLEASIDREVVLVSSSHDVRVSSRFGFNKWPRFGAEFISKPRMIASGGAGIPAAALRRVVKAVRSVLKDASDEHRANYIELRLSADGLLEARAMTSECRAIASCRVELSGLKGDRGWNLARRLADAATSDRFSGDGTVVLAGKENGIALQSARGIISGPAIVGFDWGRPDHVVVATARVLREELLSVLGMLRCVGLGGRQISDFDAVRLETTGEGIKLELFGAASKEGRYTMPGPSDGEGSVLVPIGPLDEAAKHAAGSSLTLQVGTPDDDLAVISDADGLRTEVFLRPRVPDGPVEV